MKVTELLEGINTAIATDVITSQKVQYISMAGSKAVQYLEPRIETCTYLLHILANMPDIIRQVEFMQEFSPSQEIQGIRVNDDLTESTLIEIVSIALLEVFGIDFEEARKKGRVKEYTEPRKAIIVYLREYHQQTYSLVKLGKIFNQDHTTIIHAKKKGDEFLKFDLKFRTKYLRFKNIIETMLLDYAKPKAIKS